MTMKYPECFDGGFVLVFAPLVLGGVMNEEARNYVEQCIGYAAKSELGFQGTLTDTSFTWEHFGTKNFLRVRLDADHCNREPGSEFFARIQEFLNDGSPAYKRALRGKPAGYQLIQPRYFGQIQIEEVFTDVNDNGIWHGGEPMMNEVYSYLGKIRTLKMPEPELDPDYKPTPTLADLRDSVPLDNTHTVKIVKEDVPDLSLGRDVLVNVPEGAKRVVITIEF